MQITLSPDGQTLGVGLMEIERFTFYESPRFIPVHNSPGELLGQILRLWNIGRKPPTSPQSPLFRILFVSSEKAEATELLLPTSYATLLPWSRDSRRVVLATEMTSAAEHLWLAEPKNLSIKPIPGTTTPLLLLDDAWSSDGTRLKAVGFGPHPTTRTEVVFHIESGRREVTSISLSSLAATSVALQNLLGPSAISPNGQWVASVERANDSSQITISTKKDGKPTATISVPAHIDTPSFWPSLLWSPDSRKLAVVGRPRIWIYDTKTRQSVVVKAWRQVSVSPLIVWSPDSRSFYFTRSLAMPFIGLEIVRVTLRE
jgi:hypothetical protein